MCDVEIHVHQSQLNEASSENSSSSNGAALISPEVTASLMKDKFLVTAITLEDDSEDYFSQSKLNELLKVIYGYQKNKEKSFKGQQLSVFATFISPHAIDYYFRPIDQKHSIDYDVLYQEININ